MAENQENTATVEELPYTIQIEDAGPSAKKLTVDVPGEYISKKVAEQFKELRQEAALPGFRKGHVPSSLIKKRFEKDIRDQVKRMIIQEAYEKAVEQNNLQVLGEPDFGDLTKLEIKDDVAVNFTFTVEVQPTITLPELKGVKVKKPKVDITEEFIDQAMSNLREQQGKLIDVTDRAVENKDYLFADVHVKVDGNVVTHSHDALIVSRPGRVAGLQIDDLDKQLEGLKVGEVREITTVAPDNHPAENLRGKTIKIEITLKKLQKVELAEINDEFLTELGFTNQQELRDALKEQMKERLEFDVQANMRRQVIDWLNEQIAVELPVKLSEKQTGRVVARRALDLMQRGVAKERLEANIDKLREGASDESAKELKSFFILQKLAEDKKIEVTEAELNSRIAMMALQRGERPEKVKQDLAKSGDLLTSLLIQMREEKAIDAVLVDAEIEETEMEKK